MHPTLVASLAAERHGELLRVAEQQRRVRAARAARPRRTAVFGQTMWERWEQLSTRGPVQRAPQPCCA